MKNLFVFLGLTVAFSTSHAGLDNLLPEPVEITNFDMVCVSAKKANQGFAFSMATNRVWMVVENDNDKLSGWELEKPQIQKNGDSFSFTATLSLPTDGQSVVEGDYVSGARELVNVKIDNSLMPIRFNCSPGKHISGLEVTRTIASLSEPEQVTLMTLQRQQNLRYTSENKIKEDTFKFDVDLASVKGNLYVQFVLSVLKKGDFIAISEYTQAVVSLSQLADDMNAGSSVEGNKYTVMPLEGGRLFLEVHPSNANLIRVTIHSGSNNSQSTGGAFTSANYKGQGRAFTSAWFSIN